MESNAAFRFDDKMNFDFHARRRTRVELNTALDEIEQAALVRRVKGLELEYIFKHALVQDAVYKSLLKPERKHLHSQVAHILEIQGRGDLDSIAARLVQHYAEAGDDAKTLEFAKRAGDYAARVYALSEAVAFYALALQIAVADSETPTQILIDLYRARGQALYSNDARAQAWTNYEEMEHTALERGDRSLQLHSLIERALLRSILSERYDPAVAKTFADRALVLAQELGDTPAQAKILWVRMRMEVSTDAQRAVADGEQALALAQELGLREQYAYILNDLQYAYRPSGRLREALDALEQALPLWEELGNLHMGADNLDQTASILMDMGDLDRSERLAHQALRLSQQTSNTAQEIVSSIFLALITNERADFASALEHIHRARGSLREWSIGPIAALLAQVYREVGLGGRAIELLETTIPQLPHSPLNNRFMPILTGFLTRLKLRSNDLAGAARAFEPIAGEYKNLKYLSSDAWEQASFAAADLAIARGDYAAAQTTLAELINDLEQFGLSKALPEARFLQAQAWSETEEWDKAYQALAQARMEAERMNSRRMLWQILAAQSEVERKRDNPAEAATLRAQARSTIESIAAHTPEEYRESFLNLSLVQVVQFETI